MNVKFICMIRLKHNPTFGHFGIGETIAEAHLKMMQSKTKAGQIGRVTFFRCSSHLPFCAVDCEPTEEESDAYVDMGGALCTLRCEAERFDSKFKTKRCIAEAEEFFSA